MSNMHILMNSATIGARFREDILAQIDALVDSGDFGSRGEFVQYAVRKMLQNYEGRGAAPAVKPEP